MTAECFFVVLAVKRNHGAHGMEDAVIRAVIYEGESPAFQSRLALASIPPAFAMRYLERSIRGISGTDSHPLALHIPEEGQQMGICMVVRPIFHDGRNHDTGGQQEFCRDPSNSPISFRGGLTGGIHEEHHIDVRTVDRIVVGVRTKQNDVELLLRENI